MDLQEKSQIMIDLETLGTTESAVILSIAAVEFDFEGNIISEFYRKIDLNSSLNAGFTVEADTLKWWFEQSAEATSELFTNALSIDQVLFEFSKYLATRISPVLWGNSARFDLGKLDFAFRKLCFKTQWKYYDEMDVRTLANLFPDIKKNCKFEGIKHNPLDDCKHQIKYVCDILRKMKI